MAIRYFTQVGTTPQLIAFRIITNTFKLKSTVLFKKTIKPDFLEVIEIEVEGEQEEITKLMFHLKSLK